MGFALQKSIFGTPSKRLGFIFPTKYLLYLSNFHYFQHPKKSNKLQSAFFIQFVEKPKQKHFSFMLHGCN
jgi:hypothetical protein